MIKAFSKYLLSLLLLLSGYNLVHANVKQNIIHSSSGKTVIGLTGGELDAFLNNLPSTNTFFYPKHEKENEDLIDFIVYDDDEEDELLTFKKCLERANYSSSILFSRLSGCFFNNIKNSSFRENVSFPSSQRYLTFQVFRI